MIKTVLIPASLLAFFAFKNVACVTTVSPSRGEVWPKPQQQSKSDQVLQISTSFQMIVAGDYCEILEKSVQRHMDIIMGGMSYRYRQSEKAEQFYSDSVLKTLTIDVGAGCTDAYPTSEMDESYDLDVSSGTSTLISSEVWGALRGIETFTQLMYKDVSTSMRVMNKTSIHDYPRFNFRGFLIDSSRHFLSLENIKLHIDAMEATKYNVLHWHIVDDPSFPFQSKVYPDLARDGAFNAYTHIYTYNDVIEVLEYSRLRGVRVVPEFDTPGHTLSWGAGYPQLLSQCIDDSGTTTYSGPLDPRIQTTYDFVQALFTEINSLFLDETLFLGGDEVAYDCWESNPIYQEFIDQYNLTDYAGLESFYIEKLLEIVQNLPLKRQAVVWQEVFDNGLNISKSTVVNVWKSGGYQDELSSVTAQGFDVILSAPWYLNYISYGQDWKNYYQVEPMDFSGTETQKDHFVGCEACMWGEYVDDTNFLATTWPRAATVAERAWSNKNTTDINDAQSRLDELRCRLINRGVPAEPISPGFCEQEWNVKGMKKEHEEKRSRGLKFFHDHKIKMKTLRLIH